MAKRVSFNALRDDDILNFPLDVELDLPEVSDSFYEDVSRRLSSTDDADGTSRTDESELQAMNESSSSLEQLKDEEDIINGRFVFRPHHQQLPEEEYDDGCDLLTPSSSSDCEDSSSYYCDTTTCCSSSVDDENETLPDIVTDHPTSSSPSTITLAEYQQRREQLLEKVGNATAIFRSAPMAVMHNDVEYAYRQDSDFFYLTGFNEPDAVAVFAPHHEEHKFILFVRPKDLEKETWTV